MIYLLFFFFNDTATTEIYTLSLHDALPISVPTRSPFSPSRSWGCRTLLRRVAARRLHPLHVNRSSARSRSEEHTSELQSRQYLVCRLLLEKKKQIISRHLHLLDCR